jgi:hypothetical protein
MTESNIVVRRGRTFWEPTRQLAAVAIRGDGRLSLEAVRNEWATRRIEISGPASSDLSIRPCTRHGAPGSNAAARIVECNPRRHGAVDDGGERESEAQVLMRFQGMTPATESWQESKSSRGMVGPQELGTSRYAVGLAIPHPVARLQSRTPLHQAGTLYLASAQPAAKESS